MSDLHDSDLLFRDDLPEEELEKLLAEMTNNPTDDKNIQKVNEDDYPTLESTAEPKVEFSLETDAELTAKKESVAKAEIPQADINHAKVTVEDDFPTLQLSTEDLDKTETLPVSSEKYNANSSKVTDENLSQLLSKAKAVLATVNTPPTIDQENVEHAQAELVHPQIADEIQLTQSPELPLTLEPQELVENQNLLTSDQDAEANTRIEILSLPKLVKVDKSKNSLPSILPERTISQTQTINNAEKLNPADDVNLNSLVQEVSAKNDEQLTQATQLANITNKVDEPMTPENLNAIKQQIATLQSQIHEMTGQFFTANEASAKLIGQVRDLQLANPQDFPITYEQTHELRTKLVNARKQFIELTSLLDLVEDALENESYTKLTRPT